MVVTVAGAGSVVALQRAKTAITEVKTEVAGNGRAGGVKETSGGYPALARPSQTTPSNVILGDLDSLGRPTGVTAVIKPETLGGGSSANPAIRPPGFEGQGANHARGHLLANSLGGAGDDARNLVTLFQRNTNHPNMSSFERQVKAAIQGGETVSYRAIPIYTGSNPMPTGVTLTARGSGGFNLDVSIPNINGVR
jgi:filamentous hemagglutinin